MDNKNVDYFKIENCYVKIKNVNSRLVYGDEKFILEPWITVVIPTYRRVHLLKEAIDSILNQENVDFFWDIVVVDNEPDDHLENDTERLIKEIDNPRILYYRNSSNIWVGDNFNRCIQLARGEWVMMLHDDDLLMKNALKTIGYLINRYDGLYRKPLGAISASYIQVTYDPITDEIKEDIEELNHQYSSGPIDSRLYRLTNNNVMALSHIGGAAPTNGTTFRKKAMLEIGGFNKEYGISGDLIIFYKLEDFYSVYQTISPLGFYRWGMNSMTEEDSLYKVIKNNHEFRNAVYNQTFFNRILGSILRSSHFKRFSSFAIAERVNISGENITLNDFSDIYCTKPNPIIYGGYLISERIYCWHKKRQTIRNVKKTKSKCAAIMDFNNLYIT